MFTFFLNNFGVVTSAVSLSDKSSKSGCKKTAENPSHAAFFYFMHGTLIGVSMKKYYHKVQLHKNIFKGCQNL